MYLLEGRKAPDHNTISRFRSNVLSTDVGKVKQYIADVHICGERNSYSKTDHDATFMHMKEDYMRNGQLKPGYNVNVATSNEFIIGTYISADRSDVQTLIPFMERLKGTYEGYRIWKVVVDSGYESEEN